MMVLPYPRRSAWLKGFSVVISTFSGALIGVISWLLGFLPLFGVGVFLAIVLVLSALKWPQAISKPYRAWNKLAQNVARGMELYLSGICFYVIVGVVSLAGSSLERNPSRNIQSEWQPREMLIPGPHRSQSEVSKESCGRKGWIRTYVSWAINSGNWWAVSLLPFLILLKTLESGRHPEISSDTYTLF
ncbi:MAG: hypothetical protein V3W37_09385 [Candidatus Binatia bacterium]